MKNGNQLFRAISLAVILCICLLGFVASAQQAGPPPKGSEKKPSSTATLADPSSAASSPKVILKVGDTQVTQSEMESLTPMRPSGSGHGLSADAKRRMAEQFVKMVALSQQAANDHLDASPELRFKLEVQRMRTLAQAELDKVRSQIQITPEENRQYYADHPLEFDTVQVREFLVRKRQDTEDANSTGLGPEEAKTIAESIRKKLASGDDPDKIAEDFSGPDVLLIDRKPRNFRRDEMIPALQKAAFEAKDGTAAEAVDTPDAVIVVDVLAHGHLTEKEATKEIEKKLQQTKLDAKIEEMKKKVGVWMDDGYFKDDAEVTPVSTTQPASGPK